MLSFACAVVFAGFSIAIFDFGGFGIVVGALIVILGAVLIWLVEVRTKQCLDADTKWNDLMKADGDDFIQRSESD